MIWDMVGVCWLVSGWYGNQESGIVNRNSMFMVNDNDGGGDENGAAEITCHIRLNT